MWTVCTLRICLVLGALTTCSADGIIEGLQPEQMTDVLNKLLDNYDHKFRPNLGKGPVVVDTYLEVRSMGPLNEKEMVYSMQIYFRQIWVDERLRFDLTNTTELTLSQAFLGKIWRPPTFFLNGIITKQNIITVPNFFVRIKPDGSIYLSKRLSITARCPMNLVKYPMDTPACPLIIGGYGFTTDEIVYRWLKGPSNASVTKGPVAMAQFELYDIKAYNYTIQTAIGTESILKAHFYFTRYLGYYTLNMYLPCYLTVSISWVSFWINRDATPARVLLGVTTLLSITTIGITVRFGLPGVPYATALDLFFIVCFVYVFASLVEFAAVHFFTDPALANKKDSMDGKQWQKMYNHCDRGLDKEHEGSDDECDDLLHTNEIHHKSDYLDLDNKEEYSCPKSVWHCLSGNMKYRNSRGGRMGNCANAVSSIDVGCRKLFPLSFLGINLLYWIVYLDDRVGGELDPLEQ